ncbi:hypothetical protein [Deinococcus aluminii]|uniref:PH domain-containing protein n=1 Tax=Deinococcus aluminii TaxID=1656885 RepID=A0ABP9XEC5_9DEIO
MVQARPEAPQVRMNAEYRRIPDGLPTNAEREVRLAWLDTLRAALEIYATRHLIAYGECPWPREVQP